MSIIGVFAGLFCASSLFADSVKTSVSETGARERAKANGQPFYLDRKGREYFTETGEKCYFARKNGDHVILALKDDRVLYNIDKARRDKRDKEVMERAKANGCRLYRIPSIQEGEVYREFGTNRLYKKFHQKNNKYLFGLIKANTDPRSSLKYEYVKGDEDYLTLALDWSEYEG